MTSDLMAPSTCSEAVTIARCVTFGRMCRNMMRASLAPSMRAASTYSRLLCLTTSPRIRRQRPTQPTVPMAMQIDRMPFPST